MNKIKLEVLGLSGKGQGTQQAYAMVLKEADGSRRLPIIIGHSEAQAIALALENLKPVRPLTHDLFNKFITTIEASIKEVIIVKLESNIFYSEIVFFYANKEYKLDARTSDAIIMAMKSNAPIYIMSEIMDKVGIDISQETESEETEDAPKEEEKKKGHDILDNKSIAELKALLQKAISDEDYEYAARIRDLIKNKENLND